MCSQGTCIASDAGTTPPSCATEGAGLTNCGSPDGGAEGGESCCTSLEVPGGTYFRTYANSGSGPTGEADPATVSGFRLDKYEVTVGRFRQFVSAWKSRWLPAPGSGIHVHLNGGQGLANVAQPGTFETGWWSEDDANIAPTDANLACTGGGTTFAVPSVYDTWTPAPGTKESFPINCVDWYDADAFCIWDGGFLPSEAEWEYASAGGEQQLEYPWGAMPPGAHDLFAIYDFDYPRREEVPIAPVGSARLGKGLWGQLDLAGEVYEWNLDYWDPVYSNPCADCAYLDTVSFSYRVLRGGAFDEESPEMLPPSRNFNTATYRHPGVGFRCARTP